MFANTKNKDAINDAQQVISDDIFDSFYNKLFNLFLKSYGSLDNWEQSFLIVELQVLDSNGSVVCQTKGFVNYNTLEG